jgi:TRAP-type uncharacterized transport system fused permease subunit
MAVYAANGISRATLMDTSWAAVKMGLTAYIIPFMFVSSPALLLIGETGTVITAALTATVGVICLAGGLHEFFFLGRARFWERAMLLAAALLLIKPGLVTDAIGAALIVATLLSQRLIPDRRPKAGAPDA